MGISTRELNKDIVNVVDPTNPVAVLLAVDIGDTARLVTSTAVSIDATTRVATVLGAPLAWFLKDGQLFQINLARGATPAAVRVSALDDGCSFQTLAPLDSSGLDAWLVLETAGDDGACASKSDNRHAFVRSGSSTAAAPTVLAAGVKVLPGVALADAAGRLLWVPAIDASNASAPRLVAYGATLARADVGSGAGVAQATVLNPGASLGTGIYLRAGNALRLLSGNAAGLSVSPSLYTFTSSFEGDLGVADGAKTYFGDADKLWVVQGAAPPTLVAALDPAAGSVFSVAQNSTELVVRQSAAAGYTTSAVPKTGGGVVRLFTSNTNTNVKEPVVLGGAQLVYFTGSAGRAGDLRRIRIDGSGDELVAAGVFGPGVITARQIAPDFTLPTPASRGLLYCQPLAGAADCRGGSLVQLDLSTFATAALGSFAASTVPAWTFGGTAQEDLRGGVVSAVGSGAAAGPAYARRDMYLFDPGQPGSLRRVTSTLP